MIGDKENEKFMFVDDTNVFVRETDVPILIEILPAECLK
jgi:hypothetical protein